MGASLQPCSDSRMQFTCAMQDTDACAEDPEFVDPSRPSRQAATGCKRAAAKANKLAAARKRAKAQPLAASGEGGDSGSEDDVPSRPDRSAGQGRAGLRSTGK